MRRKRILGTAEELDIGWTAHGSERRNTHCLVWWWMDTDTETETETDTCADTNSEE